MSSDVPLEIRFLDPIKPVKKGREARFQVFQAGAKSAAVPVEIERLEFFFEPITWGRVSISEDGVTGTMHVIEMVRTQSVYQRPQYKVQARLRAEGGAELEDDLYFNIIPSPPVLELRFTVTEYDETDSFDPLTEEPPLDLQSDFVIDPPRAAELFTVGGRVYARVLSVDPMPKLTVRFPTGDVVTLVLDPAAAIGGSIRGARGLAAHQPAAAAAAAAAAEPQTTPTARAPEPEPASAPGRAAGERSESQGPAPTAPAAAGPSPSETGAFPAVRVDETTRPAEAINFDEDEDEDVEEEEIIEEEEVVEEPIGATDETVVAEPAPAPAPEPAPAEPRGDADLDAALARVAEMKKYVSSFVIQGRNATAETIERVRDRVMGRVAEVRAHVEGYVGPRREELMARFEEALGAIPAALRAPAAGEGEEQEAETAEAEAEA